MFAADLLKQAETLIGWCRQQKLMLVTAESCTGGLVAALLTSIPGSSDVFERGFVTYSNRAKEEALGVANATLASFGAVSAEAARAMAEGALAHAPAQIAIAITGIAGPGGGSPQKPVGLVYFGCGVRDAITVTERRFGDIGRDGVRMASVKVALDLLCEAAALPIQPRP
ncbi:MAG: CinA family protein [Methylovirgula sp.]